MISFAQLSEKASCKKKINKGSDIRTRQESLPNTILAKQNPEFCEMLAQIANSHSQSLADLLDIDALLVKGWNKKIQDALKVSEKAKAETKQRVMISTGV